MWHGYDARAEKGEDDWESGVNPGNIGIGDLLTRHFRHAQIWRSVAKRVEV